MLVCTIRILQERLLKQSVSSAKLITLLRDPVLLRQASPLLTSHISTVQVLVRCNWFAKELPSGAFSTIRRRPNGPFACFSFFLVNFLLISLSNNRYFCEPNAPLLVRQKTNLLIAFSFIHHFYTGANCFYNSIGKLNIYLIKEPQK